MSKSVTLLKFAGAMSLSLGIAAASHAQSYDPYTSEGLGLQSQMQSQRTTVMGLNLKVPFGMQSGARDLASQPRLSFGANFTGTGFGYDRAGSDFDLSMGLTFSGDQYLAFGGTPISALTLKTYLDDAEEESGGSNTALLIVGGVVLGAAAIMVVTDEIDDDFSDTFADIIN